MNWLDWPWFFDLAWLGFYIQLFFCKFLGSATLHLGLSDVCFCLMTVWWNCQVYQLCGGWNTCQLEKNAPQQKTPRPTPAYTLSIQAYIQIKAEAIHTNLHTSIYIKQSRSNTHKHIHKTEQKQYSQKQSRHIYNNAP